MTYADYKKKMGIADRPVEPSRLPVEPVDVPTGDPVQSEPVISGQAVNEQGPLVEPSADKLLEEPVKLEELPEEPETEGKPRRGRPPKAEQPVVNPESTSENPDVEIESAQEA